MLTLFASPIFFIAAVTLVVLGLAFLAVLWREGWIIAGFGLLAMGMSVPGWLTVVGCVSGIGAFVTYVVWRGRGLGRSF